MSVSINLSEGNQVTIQRVDPTAVTLLNLVPNEVTIQQQSPIAVFLANAVANQVNVQQQDNIAVSLTNQTPNAVTVRNALSGGGTWGNISGTITNQTDLVNYITSRLSSDTINDAADVLQVLDNAGLTFEESSIDAKVPFTIFGTDENGDLIVIPQTTTPLGYTLPKPNTELLSGVPYFMVTKSNGTNINLSWLNLGFVLGDDDQYILDGGNFNG